MKVIRLYFWFKGTPANRVGGPWWYKDFSNTPVRRQFVNDARLFLEKAVTYDGKYIEHTSMDIYPPKSQEVICKK